MSILTVGTGTAGFVRFRTETGLVLFAGFFLAILRAAFLTDFLAVLALRTVRFVVTFLTFATPAPKLCNGRHLISVTVRWSKLDETVTDVN